MNSRTFVTMVVAGIGDGVGRIDDPLEAQAFLLSGVVCNVIKRIKPEQWRLMMAVAGTPCGKPGCQCHIYAAKAMEALNDLVEFHASNKE